VTRFYWNFSNDTAWLDRAEEAARAALKIDAALPEARFALAYALEGKGQRTNAVREYFASLKAGPNYAPAVNSVARWLFYMGSFERSVKELDQLLKIDPTKNIHIRKAMCLYFMGRPRESLAVNREAEKLAAGVDQLTLVAFTYAWLKEFESAERVLARLEQQDPKALSISEVRAWLYTMKGQIPQARKEMETIARRPTYGIADEIATLYAVQGERELALQWLAKAIELGAPNYAWYSSDFFKALRGDARYDALLKKLADEYRPLLLEAPARS
jgi:tetratricopeptide (TPR) repeat protein